MGMKFIPNQDMNFIQIWQFLQDIAQGDKEIITRFAFLCWHIWKHRCARILGSKEIDPVRVIVCAQRAFYEFWEIKGNTTHKSQEKKRSEEEAWEKPSAGGLKVNCDAAFQDSKTGLGLIVRNEEGVLLDARSVYTKAGSVLVAEALAIREALKHNIKYKFMPVVHVESDSHEVINSIKNQMKCKTDWRLYTILKDVRKYSEQYRKVEFNYISRRANKAADWAAKAAIRTLINENWVDKPPMFLVQILDKNGLPAPPQQ